MSVSRIALGLAAVSLLGAPLFARAAAPEDAPGAFTGLQTLQGPPAEQAAAAAAENSDPRDALSDLHRALMLDAAAPAPEQPNIHGFFTSPFKTAYVTPRGLVVQNEGLVWQPVVGLVFPIGDVGPLKQFTFVGGIWNSVDTAEQNAFVGAWDEMDVFASFSATVANVVALTLTYSPWNSPQHAFRTEHNVDLKIAYDDTKAWGQSGFALNPYLDLFWAVGGDSTVILGRKGGTGYVEVGVAPSYTFKFDPAYPVTISIPIYTQVGPSSYWDRTHTFSNSDFGLVSASLNVTMPLSFIPARYGHWHADAGVTYDYLINNALLHAGTLASGNTNHNVIIGSVGFGVNF